MEPVDDDQSIFDIQPTDVVFAPLFHRDNYEGSMTVLISALADADPNVRASLVETSQYKAPDYMQSRTTVVAFGAIANSTLLEPEMVSSIAVDVMAAITDDSFLAHIAIEEDIAQRLIDGARQIDGWRRYLRKSGAKLIICPIEHVTPAAVILAAALLEGIRYIQILHGTPVRFYAPFFSTELWVWSELTRQTFIDYGVERDRLAILGNLEVSFQQFLSLPTSQDIPVPRSKIWLFCMQDISKKHYMADLVTVRDVFARLPDDWSLRIRITAGYDWPDVIELLNDWFGGFDGRVVFTCNRRFLDDLHDVDFVCGGPTSATFTALGLGYPVALLWNDTVAEMRGEAMVSQARVCRSGGDLFRLLVNPTAVPPLLENELANIDCAPQVGAQLILERLAAQRSPA